MRSFFPSSLLALIAVIPLAAEEDLPRIVRLAANPSAYASTSPCPSGAISTEGVALEYTGGRRDEVEDLYALDIPHAANVTLELAYPNPSADFDLLLIASDSEKLSVIAAANSHERGRSERIAAQLTPGKYYVGVSAVEGSSTYALTLSAPELFGASNVEVEKVFNPCPSANRSSVLSAGSDLKATVTVTDPLSDTTRQSNGRPTIYEAIIDEAYTASSTSRRRAVLPPPPCSFAVSATTQTITSTAGTGSVGITAAAGCSWTASSNTTWLTVTTKTGTGSGTVSYSFLANTSSSSRTTNLTVGGKTVAITQSAACTFTVSPTSQDFTAAGGTGTISVTTRSDCAWTASPSTTATWITITAGQSGTGNGSVTYSVAANTSTSSRSGTITVGGRSVSVSQSLDTSSCTYSLEYTNKSISWCGGERTIKVTTQGDCPWTTASDASWLTVALPSRSGTRDQGYTIAQNTTGSSRQATLTIAGMPVRFTQNARSGSGTYDGSWSGTTNGGRAVSMCVADGALQSASISVRLDFITFSCTTPLIIQKELSLTGNTFSGTFTTFPEVSNVFTTVRGTFTSATALNGNWGSFSDAYFIFCGSTVGFGTAGTILSSGTFNATKQP
jgi:hypothetical protein